MAKQAWQKNEKKDAKKFGARQTPRSGGLWFAKGDSKSKYYLLDSKLTDHESFSVSKRIWSKLAREALLSSRVPLLSLTIGKEEFGKRLELVVMDKNDFEALIDKLRIENP